MAKAKVLSDKVVIESKILTDEILRKVSMRCPSLLVLKDEDKVVFEIANDSKSSMSQYGVVFSNGKVDANLKGDSKDVMEYVKNTLSMINEVESNVSDAIKDIDAADKKLDIEVL